MDHTRAIRIGDAIRVGQTLRLNQGQVPVRPMRPVQPLAAGNLDFFRAEKDENCPTSTEEFDAKKVNDIVELLREQTRSTAQTNQLITSIGEIVKRRPEKEFAKLQLVRDDFRNAWEGAFDDPDKLKDDDKLRKYLDVFIKLDELAETVCKDEQTEGGIAGDDFVPLECEPFLDCACYCGPDQEETPCQFGWKWFLTCCGSRNSPFFVRRTDFCIRPCNFFIVTLIFGVCTLLVAALVFTKHYSSGYKDLSIPDNELFHFFVGYYNNGSTVTINDIFTEDDYLGKTPWCEDQAGQHNTETGRSIYAGLALGLTFGFLDNWGLFYGMENLDPLFYWFASRIMATLTVFKKRKPNTKHDAKASFDELLALHGAASDVMAGLGNTFSDFLGILVGTAALEIAKAGLGVDPTFWVLDLASIVVGCMLGAFLPAVQKHGDKLTNGRFLGIFNHVAMAAQLLIAVAIFLCGFPACTPNGYLFDSGTLGLSIVLMICAGGITLVFLLVLPLSTCGSFSSVFSRLKRKTLPPVAKADQASATTPMLTTDT